MLGNRKDIEKQARMLAKEYHTVEDISAVYWFKDLDEVRLVVIDKWAQEDKVVTPCYFKPDKEEDGCQYTTGVANILRSDFKKAKLPKDWGTWADAIKIKQTKHTKA